MVNKLQIAATVTAKMVTDKNGVIEFVDANGVTSSIPQATLDEIDAAFEAQVNVPDPAVTGNQKLLDLGLSQQEATALTGYVPPSE